VADPLTYSLFIPLDGFAFRLLRGKAEGMKEPTDMIDMVGDPECAADDFSYTRTGPEIGIESCSGRSLQKEGPQGFSLLGVQQRRTSRGLPRFNASFSFASLPLQPPIDCPHSDFEFPGGFRRCKLSLQNQLNRFFSPFFKLRSFSKWSHLSPFPKFGETITQFTTNSNYLYRNQ